jgi:hypothetical protein
VPVTPWARAGVSTTDRHPGIPVQLRHGARLIGRGQTEDNRVVAVWEYNDRHAYERIDAAARANPATQQAREQRARLPMLITATEETFMSSAIT